MMPRLHFAAETLCAGAGGISRVARLILRCLPVEQGASGLDCSVISLRDDASVREDLSVDSLERLRFAGCAQSRLRFLLRQYTAGLRATHFFYDFVGLARAHPRLPPPWPRRPFGVFMHGIEWWEGTRPDRIEVARRADLLVCNSAYSRNRANQAYGGFERAQVCWLATEADTPPRAATLVSDRPPTCLIVGRLLRDRPKGHEPLIQAWPRVRAEVRDARLVVVGTGPDLQRLQGLAVGLGVGDAIEFRGFVDDENLDRLYAEARAFAMPSLGEGFGLVYLEAMRHALPVIASTVDAAGEIISDTEQGYLVDYDDDAMLASRLIDVLSDGRHAAQLGAAGHRRWEQEFRFSRFKKRFTPILQRFVES